MLNTITQLPQNILGNNGIIKPDRTAIAFLERGNIVLEYQEKEIFCPSGSLIFLNIQRYFQILEASEDIVLHILYDENQDIISEISRFINPYQLQDIFYQNIQFSTPIPQKNHLLDIIHQIKFYLGKPNDFVLKNQILHHLGVLFASISLNILFGNNEQIQKQKTRYQTISDDFMRLAIYHFSQERELDFYAQKLHISVRYLSQCIQKTTQNTPSKILHKLLINRAKFLILKTQKSIGEIAYELSFSTPYAFSKFFKQQLGISPYHFRNKK